MYIIKAAFLIYDKCLYQLLNECKGDILLQICAGSDYEEEEEEQGKPNSCCVPV
jgi:hypothetical protein